MVAFYSQADQDIYDEGDHFIPQEQYRLGKFSNTVAPMPMDSTQQVTQEFGIPYTNAFTGGGGGGGGLGGKFGNLDESDWKMIDKNVWEVGGPANMYGSWVNKPVKGYYDPQTKTYKTWEGKNIDHAGLFTGDPDEGDIKGIPTKIPSMFGILKKLREKIASGKEKLGEFIGGKDETITTTTDGDGGAVVTDPPHHGEVAHGTGGRFEQANTGSPGTSDQGYTDSGEFAGLNQGGRVGFEEGGRNFMGDYDPQNTTGWQESGQVETWNPGGGGTTTTSFEGDKNNQSNTGGITKFVDDKNVVDVDWKTIDPSIQLNLDRSKYLAQLDLLESIKNQELEGQIGATLGPVDFTTMINEGNIGNTNVNYDNWSANFDANANLQNIGYENNIKGWDVGGSYYPENQNLMFNISKTFKHGGLAGIL